MVLTMNAAHLHLLVNHLPIVGTLLSVPLLALAFGLRDRGVWLAATVVLAISGVGVAAAYFSGEPAEGVVEDLAGVDKTVIHEHEERAEVAAVLTGVAALIGVFTFALGARRPRLAALPLVAAMAASAALGWTGEAGGRVRHTELRDAPAGSSD
jgi:hypothetical protein